MITQPYKRKFTSEGMITEQLWEKCVVWRVYMHLWFKYYVFISSCLWSYTKYQVNITPLDHINGQTLTQFHITCHIKHPVTTDMHMWLHIHCNNTVIVLLSNLFRKYSFHSCAWWDFSVVLPNDPSCYVIPLEVHQNEAKRVRQTGYL